MDLDNAMGAAIQQLRARAGTSTIRGDETVTIRTQSLRMVLELADRQSRPGKPFRIEYMCRDVDHMPVTTEYTSLAEADEQYRQTMQLSNLRWARLIWIDQILHYQQGAAYQQGEHLVLDAPELGINQVPVTVLAHTRHGVSVRGDTEDTNVLRLMRGVAFDPSQLRYPESVGVKANV